MGDVGHGRAGVGGGGRQGQAGGMDGQDVRHACMPSRARGHLHRVGEGRRGGGRWGAWEGRGGR